MGDRSKVLSVTNVAPQEPRRGDAGPFAICSLSWVSSACAQTGHTHAPCWDLHSWHISWNLDKIWATHMSLRGLGGMFGGLEPLIVQAPQHKALGSPHSRVRAVQRYPGL